LHNGPEDFHFEPVLSGLEPQLYQLVHPHYLEGFSMLKINDLLAMSSGTIKSRLHQSRKLIQNSQMGEIL
jgi:DNA-directed RNA polymerase specialized sigma24 family protein